MRIDPRDFRMAMEKAQAALDQAKASFRKSRRSASSKFENSGCGTHILRAQARMPTSLSRATGFSKPQARRPRSILPAAAATARAAVDQAKQTSRTSASSWL